MKKKYRIVERVYNKPTSQDPNSVTFTESNRYYIQQLTRNKWINVPNIPLVEVWFSDYDTAKTTLKSYLEKDKKKNYTEKVIYTRKEKLKILLGRK